MPERVRRHDAVNHVIECWIRERPYHWLWLAPKIARAGSTICIVCIIIYTHIDAAIPQFGGAMLTLQIDDRTLESVVYRAVMRALADNARPADHSKELPKKSATAADYLISSRVKADVLKYIHAPDTELGARREPHWVVASKIQEGDRVLFRDALDKAIVGCGIARHPRRGEHPRDQLPAVIVDVVKAARFPRPIPDLEFIKIFMDHDGNRHFQFPLITSRGQFYRKTYAYHLKPGIFDAIVAAANSRASRE